MSRQHRFASIRLSFLLGLSTIIVVGALVAADVRRTAVASGPINLGRVVFNVTDFNADPSGMTSSLPAVLQALNECIGSLGVLANTAGCELHFPAGDYNLDPSGGESLPINLPNQIPITISGDGQGASILQVTGSSSDVLLGAGGGVGHDSQNADGFTLHDVGFTHMSGGSPCAAICADVDIPHGHKISMYNLSFQNASTAIELGVPKGLDDRTGETNISAITSHNTGRCFLQLNGANGTTKVTGVTADGGHNVSSQVLCMPSANAIPGAQYGAGTFRLSDSSFTAFGRGIVVTGYSLLFKNDYIDDVVIDSAEDGPAVELFAAPAPSASAFPPAVIQDVRVSNSRLVSGATACVMHGAIQGVKFVNDVCVGGQPASVPPPCGTFLSQRGYVLVEVSGTAGSMGANITLNITFNGSVTTVSYGAPADASAQAMATGLGQLISSSPAVMLPCPPLEPVQVFEDYLGTATSTDYSIGVDLELYTFEWGAAAPTFSASSSGGATVNLVGISATPMPADAMFSGSPPTTANLAAPSDITVDSTLGFGAANGAGLHLQGSAGAMFTRNTFGSATLPNAVGVEVATSGVAYSDTQIQGNNLTRSTAAVAFIPGVTSLTGVALSANPGYNPVGIETRPTTTCGVPTTNPFPTAQQVYVRGAFNDIIKDGERILGSGSSAIVALGVGESVEIDCTSLPQIQWYGS